MERVPQAGSPWALTFGVGNHSGHVVGRGVGGRLRAAVAGAGWATGKMHDGSLGVRRHAPHAPSAGTGHDLLHLRWILCLHRVLQLRFDKRQQRLPLGRLTACSFRCREDSEGSGKPV